ncbi:MAG: hypothetical protein VX949_07630 [Planctomycetota bacterium]|nr:hypothetical protein [Planctomycetota bacterium]
MTDSLPEASSDDQAPARIVASRSVLMKVQQSHSEDPDGLLLAPVFKARGGNEETVGLVPRLDAGLDSGHRFAMLGAVFRPMRQFLRRTLDGDEDTELSSELGTGEPPSIGKE